MRLPLTLLPLLALSCAALPAPPAPAPAHTEDNISVISLCPDLDYAVPAWRHEIARRFPKAVAIFVHGGDAGGVWMCAPHGAPPLPVESLAAIMVKLWPDRECVILSCNPGHRGLNHPVWYSSNILSQLPAQGPTTQRVKGEEWTVGLGGFKRGLGGE